MSLLKNIMGYTYKGPHIVFFLHQSIVNENILIHLKIERDNIIGEQEWSWDEHQAKVVCQSHVSSQTQRRRMKTKDTDISVVTAHVSYTSGRIR